MVQPKRVRPSEKSHVNLTTDVDAEAKKGSAKRLRMSCTSPQLVESEKECQNASYLRRLQRYKISQNLKSSGKQVKAWFQNRRMKDKMKSKSNKSIKSNCNDTSKRALSSSATTSSSETIFEEVINNSEQKNDSSASITLTTTETTACPPGKHSSKISSNNSQTINNEIFDQDIEMLDFSETIFETVTSDSESPFLVTPAITETVTNPLSTHPSNVSSNKSPILNEFFDQCIKLQNSLESVCKTITDDPLTWTTLIIGKIDGNLTCILPSNVSNNSPIINNEIIDQCNKMQDSSKTVIKTATNYSEPPILETSAITEIVANPSCMHPSNVSSSYSPTIINEISDQDIEMQDLSETGFKTVSNDSEALIWTNPTITETVTNPSCMHPSNVSSNKTSTLDEIMSDISDTSNYSSTTESTQETQIQKSSCKVLQNDNKISSKKKFATTKTVTDPSDTHPTNVSSNNSSTLQEIMNKIINDGLIINIKILDPHIGIMDPSEKVVKTVTNDSEPPILMTPNITETVANPSCMHSSNVSSNYSPTIKNEIFYEDIEMQDLSETVFKTVTDDSKALICANSTITETVANPSSMHPSNVSSNKTPTLDEIMNKIRNYNISDTSDSSSTTDTDSSSTTESLDSEE